MQTDATLLANNTQHCWAQQCCDLLRSFAWAFRFRYLRPMETDATSHNIVGPNNVGSCLHLLRGACKRTQQLPTLLGPTMLGVLVLVGTCCVVHANERNNCQHCWRKFIILALITALSVPSFSSICL